MSIFRLFKSAVVLSVVLYFEGCGGGKKTEDNKSKTEGDKTGAEENQKEEVSVGGGDKLLYSDEITTKVDKAVDKLIKELNLSDASDIAVLKAAGEKMKKEITDASSTGDLSDDKKKEIMNKTLLDPVVVEVVFNIEFDKMISTFKISDPADLAVIEAARKEVKDEYKAALSKGEINDYDQLKAFFLKATCKPDLLKVSARSALLLGSQSPDPALVKMVTDASSKAVDEFTAAGKSNGIEKDLVATQESLLNILAEELAKHLLGASADEKAIDSKKAEVMADFKAAMASNKHILEKYFKKPLVV